MNFTRGISPKEAMKTGKYANPKKVRCLKNQYSEEYKKLRFVKKQIYEVDSTSLIQGWLVYDCYGRGIIFADKTFNEYFEIYA